MNWAWKPCFPGQSPSYSPVIRDCKGKCNKWREIASFQVLSRLLFSSILQGKSSFSSWSPRSFESMSLSSSHHVLPVLLSCFSEGKVILVSLVSFSTSCRVCLWAACFPAWMSCFLFLFSCLIFAASLEMTPSRMKRKRIEKSKHISHPWLLSFSCLLLSSSWKSLCLGCCLSLFLVTDSRCAVCVCPLMTSSGSLYNLHHVVMCVSCITRSRQQTLFINFDFPGLFLLSFLPYKLPIISSCFSSLTFRLLCNEIAMMKWEEDMEH